MKVTREHILDEIKRTASANGGVALGEARFFQATGVKPTDWHGKYWSRWGDAVAEAGFSRNTLNEAYPSDVLLSRLAQLCRGLGKFPVRGELKITRHSDPTFPSYNVFANRFGTRAGLVHALAEFCRERSDFADVAAICAGIATDAPTPEAPARNLNASEIGFVYLLKSGRFYKIGRSNAVGRRERELAIQLPEKGSVVHAIKTDDPGGIEDYWHRRFEDRRKNGEWFQLTADDVAAFRRRRFM